MSDDSDSGEDGAEAVDPQLRSRISAQGAAGDLARMGIDPRSLGLDDPQGSGEPRVGRQAEGPAGPAPAEDDQTDRVVPLRPELGELPTGQASTPRLARQPVLESPQPHVPGPVEQLIARTASRKPAPKAPSRLAKAVGLGLVTPDAAEAAGVERELVAALKQRQTERRVISFLSGKGGVGTTTVACAVGIALAALREDHTCLVDAQAGTPSLAALYRLAEAVSGRGLLAGGDVTGPALTPAGLGLVDGAGWEQPLQRQELIGVLDRLGADNTFTLVDVGRDAGEASHAALARCDQAVIVTPVGEMGVAALDVAVTRLRQVNPAAAERAVYAVVCHHVEAYRRVHREVVQTLAIEPARVVVVPPDETLRSGQVFDPSLVAAATREAMLEVAAALAMSGDRR